MQAVPKDARPIKSWPDDDEAFLDVVGAIKRSVQEVRRRAEEARRRVEEEARQQAEEAPSTTPPPEPLPLQPTKAPDRLPAPTPPSDTKGFLSQAINSQTLADFTRWKYPNLPLNEKVHELLIGDLDHGRFVTLLDVNQAIEAAARAVKCYAKENPNVFTTATDFITKSLGFVDKNFREKHGFYKPTLDAFSKYEHLVELTRSPEMVQDHQVIYDRPKEADTEHASGREPGPLGTRFWWRVSGIVFIVILTAVMMRSSLFDKFLPGGDRPSEKQTPVPAPVGTPAPEPSRTTTSGPSWAPESLLDQRNDPPGGTGGMEITSNSTVAQSFTVGRDGRTRRCRCSGCAPT